MRLKHARIGQMVVSEYVLLFFVVIAGVSAMTLFVQRTLQARQRDGQRYVVDMASQACQQATQGNTVDCLGAAGAKNSKIAREYEPYYGYSSAKVQNDSMDKRVIDGNARWGKYFATSVKTGSNGAQLPPENK